MRASEKLIVLAVIVAVVSVQTGSALKCYICNNHNDGKECGHGTDVDSKFLKDCDTESNDQHNVNYTLCRKITTWIDFDVNNNTATERITRKCGYLLEEKYNTACYYRGGFGGRQQVCSCMEDGCNSVGFNKPNVGVIAAVVGVLVAKLGLFYY